MLRENSYYEIVLYDVPLSLTDDLFTDMMKRYHRCIVSARRILRYPDREPTTLVRVRLNSRQSQQTFLRNGIDLGEFWFSTQRSRKRNTRRRCYNCQRIGLHLSRNCTFEKRCVKCAGYHFVQDCNSRTEKCANCDGPHSADSRACQHWVQSSQHGIESSGVVTNQELMISINDLKITLNENVNDILKKFESIESDIEKLRHSIVPMVSSKSLIQPTVLSDDSPRPCEFQPPTADEPSAVTDRQPADPPVCPTVTMPSVTVTHDNPENDSSNPGYDVASACSLDSESCRYDKPRVNSEIVDCFIMETDHVDMVEENMEEITPNCDTDVNANKELDKIRILSKWFDPWWNPDDDPVYNEYQERMFQLPETERDKFQELWNPYLCEVLFRYSGGKIGKMIDVIAIDGTAIHASPCNTGIKMLKGLKTSDIRCCPFHHLSSVIRDCVDKTDLSRSLRKWRTKDLTPIANDWFG